MSLVFPESYDELDVLRHHGATDDELARRLAERELMSQDERFRADVSARAHVGPTIDDHRARWAEQDRPPTIREVEPSQRPAGALSLVVAAGTVSEVLAWVGTDQARARAAIEAEDARPSPRTSLLAKLRTVAGG